MEEEEVENCEQFFLSQSEFGVITVRCLPPAGSLLHRSAMKPGHTYLTITIDKIGLKSPNAFIDPFITVSLKSEPTTTLI